jgi:hypothetical protein
VVRRAGAEEDERAWHLLEHEGEVLRAGDGELGMLAAPGAEHLGDRLQRELRLGRVVDGDRVLGRVLGVGGQPVRGGDVRDQPRHQVRQQDPGRGAVGAGGGQEPGPVGDHVVRGAGVEGADRDHHGVEHVELPRHHGLQGEHHLAGGRDRVRRAMRLGGVPAAPVHGDRDLVGGGKQRARPGGEHPAGQPVRRHVQAVGGDRALARHVEHTLADHVPGARVPLLARLEHEDHRAGQVGPPGREQPRGAGQHGGVQVVAAGVHHARHRRRVRQPGLLGDGQRVHVAAQQHHRARPPAAQHRGHRTERAAGADLQRQPVQGAEHLGLRLRQVQADLVFPVDGVPQFRDPARQPGRLVTHRHGFLLRSPAP